MSESRHESDASTTESIDVGLTAQEREPGHVTAQSAQVGTPIDVVAAVRAAAIPTHRQRSWGWWALAGVGVFVNIVLAAGLVQVVTGSVHPGHPTAAATRPVVDRTSRPIAMTPQQPTVPVTGPDVGAALAATRWESVVSAIDDARAAAFARADVSMVAAFDAPGSVAYAADVAAVKVLKSRGVRADGFVLDVAAVRVRSATAEAAQLLVTDSRPAFDWRSQNNSVVARVAARTRASWLVQVKRGGALGWQVVSVRATTPAVQQPASQQSSGP